jgi:hypothetical protein
LKRSNKRGSIFTLLLGNYILFTLILVVILTALLIFYFLRMAGVMQTIDTTQINTVAQTLQHQKYDEFPTERLLGAKGFIWVLDEQQKVIYQSNDGLSLPALSTEDIFCIPNYAPAPQITVYDITNAQGNPQTIVTMAGIYDENDFHREYILDEEKHLLYQFGDLPLDTLTPFQFQLLSDSFSSEFSIQKHQFETNLEFFLGFTWTGLWHDGAFVYPLAQPQN